MLFLDSLKKARGANRNTVIPDIKCRSPKEGDLMRGRNPAEYAKSLIKAWAPVLSVVTENAQFGGSEELLREIAALGVPVLRKDFLNSEADLIRTKELGASAVLLMYSCLSPKRLEAMYRQAKALGLDVLVETHDENELEHAFALGAELIGINNRDIRVLEKDDGNVSLTQQLAAKKRGNAFIVSESSLCSPDDVRRAITSGADAALIGTAILKSDSPERFFRKLCRKTQVKLCGMMNAENIRQCCEADILGFVTEYPVTVPWNLTSSEAAALLPLVPGDCKSCVVTGGKPEQVLALADKLHPDIIQLHHLESLKETEEIAKGLRQSGISVIRSVPVNPEERTAQFGASDLSQVACMLEKAGASALLIDSRGAENASQTSAATPFSEYMEIRRSSRLPVILAGGLTPENLGAALRQTGAEYIDIMTGIEEKAGIKTPDKIRQIFEITGG